MEPMDLTTVRDRLRRRELASPLALLADVRRVWAACRVYNHEGSDIVGLANQAQHAFEVAWQLEGLPLVEEQWQPTRAAEVRAEAAAQVAVGLAGPGVKRKVEETPRAKERPEESGLSDEEEEVEEEEEEDSEEEWEEEQAPAAKRQRTTTPPQPPPLQQQQQPQQQQPGPSPPTQQQQQTQKRVPARDWAARAGRVLGELLKLDAAEAFSEPVPLEYEG